MALWQVHLSLCECYRCTCMYTHNTHTPVRTHTHTHTDRLWIWPCVFAAAGGGVDPDFLCADGLQVQASVQQPLPATPPGRGGCRDGWSVRTHSLVQSVSRQSTQKRFAPSKEEAAGPSEWRQSGGRPGTLTVATHIQWAIVHRQIFKYIYICVQHG